MNKLMDSLLSVRDFVQDWANDADKKSIEYMDLRLRLYNLNKIIMILQGIQTAKQKLKRKTR
ncbi:MAG: hypothetical protein ACLRFJ_03380 [Alphaproteobacteria bacterium]